MRPISSVITEILRVIFLIAVQKIATMRDIPNKTVSNIQRQYNKSIN